MSVVIVCGGRDYAYRSNVDAVLDQLCIDHSPLTIVHGGAPGADTFAKQWAEKHSIPSIQVNAEWGRWGPAAGPIRNQKMLDRYHPDMVIVFPGGRGTADMAARAFAAGVPVYHK